VPVSAPVMGDDRLRVSPIWRLQGSDPRLGTGPPNRALGNAELDVMRLAQSSLSILHLGPGPDCPTSEHTLTFYIWLTQHM
jgi:hypothetical protein